MKISCSTPSSEGNEIRLLLFRNSFLRNCGNATFRNVFILLGGFRSTHSNSADDLPVMDYWNASLKRSKVGQRRHCETTIVDCIFEVSSRLFKDGCSVGFADGNICTCGKALFRANEVEQMTAFVDDRN